MAAKTKLTFQYLTIIILFILFAYSKETLSGSLGFINSQLFEVVNNPYLKSLIFILAADTIPLLILDNVYILLITKFFSLKNNILIYLVMFLSSLSHLQFILSPGMTWVGRILLLSLCSIMCLIIWYIWLTKSVDHEIKNT